VQVVADPKVEEPEAGLAVGGVEVVVDLAPAAKGRNPVVRSASVLDLGPAQAPGNVAAQLHEKAAVEVAL